MSPSSRETVVGQVGRGLGGPPRIIHLDGRNFKVLVAEHRNIKHILMISEKGLTGLKRDAIVGARGFL
jgi:hypothetical protein